MPLPRLSNYPVPPYAARIHRINLIPVLVVTAAWIGWLTLYAGNSAYRVFLSMGFYLMAVGVLAAPSVLRIRKLCRRLKEADFRICTGCGFDLRTLPDEYHCPECGLAYEYEIIRKQWKEWRDMRAAWWSD